MGLGFKFVVMFIDSFLDDVSYVKDVQICMHSTFCYIPGVFAMALRIFGWDLWMITVLDLLRQPHSSIP